MNELRWILLIAGLLLIAGIYAWGLRARRRAAAPAQERIVRVEPARTVPVVAEPAANEPEGPVEETLRDAPERPGSDDSEEFADFDAEPAPSRATGTARREPRIEPAFDARYEPVTSTQRIEPRLEPEPAPSAEPVRVERPAAAEPSYKPSQQKIVALRVVAPPGAQFAGDRLLDALQSDGFTFGRYQIFHRLDDAGRPLVSLASLKEPGTFDPDKMPGVQFRGVALFAVMPGALPGLRAFDELIVTARALATTLGGQMQDERGAPLSLHRLGQLREEVAEFERARGSDPDV
jgi:cell division protein ZipA